MSFVFSWKIQKQNKTKDYPNLPDISKKISPVLSLHD